MSEIGEGIGSAIEGSLLSRAVEKTAGEESLANSGDCLNCGTKLIGAYCQKCGQKAQVHRTIFAIWHDLIHGVLHLDGKFWRTLPLLALKPGEITRRYINGERAKFVSPMAMFLFSFFLMFAVFQMVGLTAPTEISPNVGPEKVIGEARNLASNQRQSSQERLDALPEGSTERAALESQIAEMDENLEGIDTAQEFTSSASGTFNANLTGVKAIDEGLIQKWRDNPGLMLYKLQANGYKFSWLLIPLSIPFVWLLFLWKRRFKAYDHAIFVTYSLSFMSLLFVTLSILYQFNIGGGWIFLALVVIPPLHIYKHLRGTYDLSRFSALWRMIVLTSLTAFVVLLLFLWLLVLLGAF